MSDDELLRLYNEELDREISKASKNCESGQCVGIRTDEVLEERLRQDYPLDYERALQQPLWADLHDEHPLSSEPIESKPHTPRLTAPQVRFLRRIAWGPREECLKNRHSLLTPHAEVTWENKPWRGVPMLDGKRMTHVQSRLFKELERKGAVKENGRVTSIGLRALNRRVDPGTRGKGK